jgi:hypothetical protein
MLSSETLDAITYAETLTEADGKKIGVWGIQLFRLAMSYRAEKCIPSAAE